MKNPLVSWHCVTFDRPDFLRELVMCFRKQTYSNRELIIVNDQENITYYCNDVNVKIYNQKKRFKSLGAKRNYTMAKCRGEFVLITDDDDIYYPQHTRHLVRHHQNTDADIVRDRFSHYLDEHNNKIITERKYGMPQCCIRKKYIENNRFNENLNAGEDVEFMNNAKIKIIENKTSTCAARWGHGVYHMSCHDEDILINMEKQQQIFRNTIKHQRYKNKIDVHL